MTEQDLTSSMQEMMAQLAQVQAELTELKARSNALVHPQPIQPVKPVVSTTRRNTLKRLGLALLGGVATATALGEASAVQAKVSANPQGALANKAGMLVVPPGTTTPLSGTAPAYTYGLIASGDITPLDLSSLPGNKIGVYGSSSGYGIYGNGSYGVSGTGTSVGVSGNGDSFGVSGNSTSIGVSGNGGFYGVYGSGTGYGVYALGGTYGVYGSGTSYAGYFSGNVNITGQMNGAAKFFKIDHPLDPANKYLNHASIESSDMMNMYNGLVTLNNQGEATVTMPDWFEALNSDFRYQLTALDTAGPNLHVAQRLQDRKFKIAGGLPGQEVSWMVTGIRQDAYAKAHPIKVEEDKTGEEKGKYLHPELFGQSEEMSVHPRPTPAK